jgi:hypothetical protein
VELMLSDHLFAIAGWILVGSVLAAGVGCAVLFLVVAVWAFRMGGAFRLCVTPVCLLIFVAYSAACAGSLLRIGERGGSYTDLWTWLRA